jgi:hypothetical protein
MGVREGRRVVVVVVVDYAVWTGRLLFEGGFGVGWEDVGIMALGNT